MEYEPDQHIRPLARPLFLRHQSPKAGVLLVHGFGDAPYSMRDLGMFLYAHGYSVFIPRLPGHGSRLEHLRRATADDWRQTVRKSLDLLRAHIQPVALIGRSFGGVLAMRELSERPQHADALVVLAAPSRIHAQRPIEIALPIVALFRRNFKKPWLKPHDRVERLEVGRYEHFPLPALKEFFRELRAIRDGRLGRVVTPTLFIHGRKDRLARPDGVDYFLEHLGSPIKEVLWIGDATHDAKSLHKHPEVQRRLLEFLANTLPKH